MMSIVIFAAGAGLLIYSAEKLITCLVGAARGLAVSLFLLAIIFTGIEFDDLAFGVVLNLEGSEDVALGVIFGTVISLTGLVLALAAIVAPSRVEIPKDYIGLFAFAPLVLIVPAFLGGVGPVSGVVLIALFVLFIAYIAYRESRRIVPTFRSAELLEAAESRELVSTGAANSGGGGHTGGGAGSLYETGDVVPEKANERPGWVWLLLALLALIGLIAGAWAMAKGTEGIVEQYAIGGTVFGATIATLVLSLEDIFLTVEPSRRGAPAIGIGNVIGSVVFSVTAKVGIIALLGGTLLITPEVFTWHLPALIVINGFAAYALFTGHLRRWHGVVLLLAYIVYWIVSFSVFGLVPGDDDATGSDDNAQRPGIEAPAVPGPAFAMGL
ncbi:MAG: sodium:proton exchanger [Mycobacterium sp.]